MQNIYERKKLYLLLSIAIVAMLLTFFAIVPAYGLVSGNSPGGDLVVDGVNYTITGDHQGTNGYNSITVKNGGTLNIQPDDTVDGAVIDVAGDVLVIGNSSIIPKGYYTTNSNGKGVTINANNIQVDFGSSIDANGQGYKDGKGSGAGTSQNGTLKDSNYVLYPAGGGGYGGAGGKGEIYNGKISELSGGNTYGSLVLPLDLGSSGGNPYGRTGGGAIKLNVLQTLTNNGVISANGDNGRNWASKAGSGSGGSILIDANNLIGTGNIEADGGKAPFSGNFNYYYGGAGGGGRVAINYTNKLWLGAITANHGKILTGEVVNGFGGYIADGTRPGMLGIENGTVFVNPTSLPDLEAKAISNNKIKITLPNINPDNGVVTYAIYNETLQKYLADTNGGLSETPIFKTYEDWNGPEGVINYNLEANKQYTYRYIYRQADGLESFERTSGSVNRYTYANAPEYLTVATSWDSVNGYNNQLSWQDFDNSHLASKFHVYYYSFTSGTWQQLGGEAITSPNYIHNNLTSGKTYYYKVFSVNDEEVENSQYAFVSIMSAGGVINANANATADYSAEEGYHVHLSWDTNNLSNPPARYHIYRNGVQIGGETITDQQFTDLGLNQNTSYDYKIYGVGSDGLESTEYAYVTARTDIAPGSSVTLQYGLNGYTATQDASIRQDEPNTNFGSGNLDLYWLYSTQIAGKSLIKFDLTDQLPADAVITSATLGLYKPTYEQYQSVQIFPQIYVEKFSKNWDESTITWSNRYTGESIGGGSPSGAQEWYQSNANPPVAEWRTFNITQIAQDAFSNSNKLVNLILKAQPFMYTTFLKDKYFYLSKEGIKNFRPYLKIVYTSESEIVAPVISLDVNSSNQITVNVTDKSSNEDDFHIYKGTTVSPVTDVAQINSTTTNATGKVYSKSFSNLLPNTRYYFRVKAHKHSNNSYSDYSNELSKYTLANIPSKLKGKRLDEGKIELSWEANGNPAGTIYELSGNGEIIYTGTATDFVQNTSLNINTYKIRAKNNEGIYSNWSNLLEVSAGSNPHANYTQNPDQCASCHSTHVATYQNLIKAPQDTMSYSDFCYACHDGSGSKYNVKQAINSNHSIHPVKDKDNPNRKLDCSDCHDPHGNKKPNGSYYAKLLKAKDKDNPNKKYYEGNQFCGACHGKDSTLIGGNHLTDVPHNTMTSLPLSGSKIRCLNCHANNDPSDEGAAPHGSDNARLTKANEEELCFLCHNDPNNSVNGLNILQKFSLAPSPGLSQRHNVNSVEQTAGGSKLECTSCHNPHKNDRKYKVADPDNPSKNFTSRILDEKEMTTKIIYGSGVTLTETDVKEPFSDLYVGKKDGLKKRAIIKFNLANIPAKAIIYKARLLLKHGYPTSVGAPLNIEIRRLTENWDYREATWSKRDSTNQWSNAGGSFSNEITEERSIKAKVSDEYVTSVTASRQYRIINREIFDVTSLVSNWVGGSYPNFGLVLMAPDAESQNLSDFYRFFSPAAIYFKKYYKPDFFGNGAKLIITYYTKAPSLIMDTASFCLKCHDGIPPKGVTISPSTSNRMKNYLDKYNGGIHGEGVSSRGGLPNWGTLSKAQARTVQCNECHDPHGNNNNLHLPENPVPQNAMTNVCLKCHQRKDKWHHNYGTNPQLCDQPCHSGGSSGFGNCTSCHYHGSKLF